MPSYAIGQTVTLWQALLAGDLQLIASDHSPCPPSMKCLRGNFMKAWESIAGLEVDRRRVDRPVERGGGLER